jgi:hypothetical protein
MKISLSKQSVVVFLVITGMLFASLGLPTAARAAGPIVVNDGSDGSSCAPGIYTLRCAINYANANPFTNIRFAQGLSAVVLQSALPTITGAGTWIDGTDGTGVYVGPRIDGLLAGSWTGNNGLTINASYVTVTNVKIVDIPTGADVSIIGGMDIVVAYDDLGILPGVSQCPGIVSTIGVDVFKDIAGSAGDNNGTAYIYANTISCHTGSGVEIVGSNFVYVGQDRTSNDLGNQIGTTVDGSGAAGNGYAGVRIAVGSDSVTVRKNLIAHNNYAGVAFDGSNIVVGYNTISANYMGMVIDTGALQMVVANNIGTSVDGLLPWPNAHEGVRIVGGSGLFMSDNLLAYNGGAGIGIVGSTSHVQIQNNNFRNNGGLPIDLGDDGATPNGSHSPPGPDDWLAYPVVTASSGSIVDGTTCPNCGVYIYQAIGDPATPGGGGTFVTTALANSSGQWSASLPNGLTHLDVSFMAYNPSLHDSSEMSPRPLYSISGNAGVAGVSLSYTGSSPVTDASDGSYTITIPSGWSGTVTPSKTGYTFAPANRTYANLLANMAGEGYTATAITYSISGNAGVAGATLSYTGGSPVTAAADGSYTINVPYNWSGTVTPSKTGYTFAPANRTYAGVLAGAVGENYAATAINYTATLSSIGAQDGWILESAETSNKGGSKKAGGATIFLGDNAARRQYRAILSFSTGPALPDNAMISSVTLKLKKQSIVGSGNPITLFKGFMADIQNGLFNLAALETKDFQTAANGSYGPFKPAPVGGWYSLDLTAGSANINELSAASGLTQIRLRFKLDDNHNAIANYLSFYSGNAPLASRPQLIIVYHLP